MNGKFLPYVEQKIEDDVTRKWLYDDKIMDALAAARFRLVTLVDCHTCHISSWSGCSILLCCHGCSAAHRFCDAEVHFSSTQQRQLSSVSLAFKFVLQVSGRDVRKIFLEALRITIVMNAQINSSSW